MLNPALVRSIGESLLEIPNIQQVRFASKMLGVLPMRIHPGDEWTRAIGSLAQLARRRMKDVCLHTHISHENELSPSTFRAMRTLTEFGVKVRNQCVLLRGVNDEFEAIYRLLKKLCRLQIEPYLVYLHDMVPGCEHLRTTLAQAERLSCEIQGTLSGFNTPRFVCDAPGGGGKRNIASYEAYDREIGASAWTAPYVKPGKFFYYFDPIDLLPQSGREVWADRDERESRLSDIRAHVETIGFSKTRYKVA
jgi:lysine 2,3-aminomutase